MIQFGSQSWLAAEPDLALECYSKLTSVHLIIKVHFWWVFTWERSIFTSSAHMERSIHMSLPQIALSSIFCYVPVKVFTIWSDHWLQPMNQYMVTHLVISPSRQNVLPSVLPEGLPTVISLHHCPSGMSQKGVVILSTWRWCLHSMQCHP